MHVTSDLQPLMTAMGMLATPDAADHTSKLTALQQQQYKEQR